LIYFDQAATSFQKPPEVLSAVQHAFLHCASVGRSGHKASMQASDMAFKTRALAGLMFDADPEQVVFTFNATHGLNIAIRSLVQPGDTVVISGFEHNAVLRPLYEIGANIIVAGEKIFDPADTLACFEKTVHTPVKAVICSHVSNVFGYVLPIAEIAEICSRHCIPFVLDASQSAGVLPISLKESGAAFIAMPGHKGLYGPQGTGILLCGQMPKPFICGGTGSDSLFPEMPRFLPDIIEAGTHNIHGISGLYEGLRFVHRMGISNILRHEQTLLARFHEQLEDTSDIRMFYAGNGCQTGVISFISNLIDCERMAEGLNEADIAVRAGLQCAPLAHRSVGTIDSGTVRVSISSFNTLQEIDKLAYCIQTMTAC